MITIRKSSDRGRARFSWLDARYTFSFGEYYDPAHMGFGPLRVINEDIVKGGGGFPTHGHDNMEIVTYILQGALEHKDSMGNGSVIKPGDIQRMSAGTGVKHSEFNQSATDPVHLLQIWFLPGARNIAPGYEQKNFPAQEKQGRFRLVASPDGRDGSVTVHQDVSMYAALLGANDNITQPIEKSRLAWVQIAKGSVTFNGHALNAGDGAAITDETALDFTNAKDTEIILFDMNP